MTYDHVLADRLRAALAGTPCTEKAMFGGLAFLVGGHMAVAASGEGGLMARVSPDDGEQLGATPGVSAMEMRGRVMTGWLRVATEVVADDAALRGWVQRSLDYVATLAPKG